MIRSSAHVNLKKKMKESKMEPLWKPSSDKIAAANMTRFMNFISKKYDIFLKDYDSLYDWSIEHSPEFWSEIWDFCGVISQTKGKTNFLSHTSIEKCKFFPEARLNYAENLLHPRNDSDVIIFWGEDQIQRRIRYHELISTVSQLAQALRELGVKKGDRVVGFMPNMPETLMAMLATASLGAIWSSCSPDFGVQGVLDRFGQITPKIMFSVDGYYYGGKSFSTLEKIAQISASLPSLEKIVITSYLGTNNVEKTTTHSVRFDSFIKEKSKNSLTFEQVSFDHPLFIMYSSGTTGVPKCIVHGHGGTLLQHLKEHQLHSDIKPGDHVFYYTTCGWMMWNWMVSALASEATLLLYDGSPLHPGPQILFEYAEKESMTLFGTSAKYIDALRKIGFTTKERYPLKSLRTLCSTGSPLVSESFDYVYEKIANDVCLASISGGTDIISCFALGNPIGPVWRGELQTRGLGLKVEVFDDSGKSIKGQKGELVCTAPFPSMPIGFWNDDNGEKYHKAYFADYENVWAHRDYVELTDHNGIIIYGRSDATLNPGGVRIGTAEIYRQVEQVPEVLESLVVGQDWKDDVRVILFVKLRNGDTLSSALKDKIVAQIRTNTTPRHVPKKIIQIPDIPRTISGKIVELAVHNVIHGEAVKNKEALANPETLKYFSNLPELATD